jgi:hypothetical protein
VKADIAKWRAECPLMTQSGRAAPYDPPLGLQMKVPASRSPETIHLSVMAESAEVVQCCRLTKLRTRASNRGGEAKFCSMRPEKFLRLGEHLLRFPNYSMCQKTYSE